MDNIFGLGLVLYGAYLYSQGDTGTGASAAILSTIFLVWNNYNKLTGFFTKKNVVSNPEQIFKPDAYELYDTECLVHLRNRCIEQNSQEGVDTCAKLNSIIYSFKSVKPKAEEK